MISACFIAFMLVKGQWIPGDRLGDRWMTRCGYEPAQCQLMARQTNWNFHKGGRDADGRWFDDSYVFCVVPQ